jgi:hypothetical protein
MESHFIVWPFNNPMPLPATFTLSLSPSSIWYSILMFPFSRSISSQCASGATYTNIVPSSQILVTLMMEALHSSSLQEPHGVTPQKTAFFIVTAVTTKCSCRVLSSVTMLYSLVKAINASEEYITSKISVGLSSYTPYGKTLPNHHNVNIKSNYFLVQFINSTVPKLSPIIRYKC